MTVYVDNMRARFGRMIMCHMIASSEEELHAMAQRIGVARRWYQGDHYDICLAMKAKAVSAGAVEIDTRQAAAMRRRFEVTGDMGEPADAWQWLTNWLKELREKKLCTCIGCGCDDMHACSGGCCWLRVDRLGGVGVCSECPDHVERFDLGDRELNELALL